MPEYTPVACQDEQAEGSRTPTESTPLMEDDFVCVSDNQSEADDGSKDASTTEPLPTTNSNAPTDASATPNVTVETPSPEPQPEAKVEDGVTTTTTASTLEIKIIDGVCTIVASSSSQSGVSSDVPEDLSAILARALSTTVADTNDATTTRAPSPLSEASLKAIKAAKQAEIKAASAKYSTVETALDAASSRFSDAKEALNTLIDQQKAVEQSYIDLFRSVAELCARRMEKREGLNELYKTASFFDLSTAEEVAKLNSDYSSHKEAIDSLDTLIEKSQDAEFLKRGDLTIKHLGFQIAERQKTVEFARRRRDVLKKEHQDQQAILDNLERELSLL